MSSERFYIAIDMKSFFASVECVARNLNPLTANLLVADVSRTDRTICLAVSPALKAIGVPARPRLFEAKQAIRRYEAQTGKKVSYITATPRMAEYIRVSALIYSRLLQYAAEDDIHVYSIDESFIDCTGYLHLYQAAAEKQQIHPARLMAVTIIRDILKTTGITATVGIGTNLYLAKVAMDIVAKKSRPDPCGVRIAELNEDSYKFLLWDHRPLTDFWQIGRGTARTLHHAGLFTMGDVAEKTQWNEEWFYRTFGINAELLIDHAWGVEPVTIADIKQYRPDFQSLSSGQVLPRPYGFEEGRNVFAEMIDLLLEDMYCRDLVSRTFSWWAVYDSKSLDVCPEYDGVIVWDFYGRAHPKHTVGTVRLSSPSNAASIVRTALLKQFDQNVDHRLLLRRLGLGAEQVQTDSGFYQLDFFTDYESLEKEKKIRKALLQIRGKYGSNAVLTGKNLQDGATARERNGQIGGHRK